MITVDKKNKHKTSNIIRSVLLSNVNLVEIIIYIQKKDINDPATSSSSKKPLYLLSRIGLYPKKS